MLVYPADRLMEIREAEKLGITAEVKKIDFSGIMDRIRKKVAASSNRMQESIEKSEEFDYYPGEAEFVADHTLSVGGKSLKGRNVFIVTGARPFIPRIAGIESVDYLTNESVLGLTERPESMIIVGGGYIAAEFAHFFEAVGTEVTLIQRNRRLVPEEEPEISDLLRTSLSRRMKVYTHTEANEVRQQDGMVTVSATERATGKRVEHTAGTLFIAAGRQSNADILQVGKTGVRTDERGYIVVDEYYETTKKGIWAFGDAIGRKMFRHTANAESELAWHNAVHGKKSRMNYLTVPHAVFSWPEIASVGLTEAEAIKLMNKREVLVGTARYADTARGDAMREDEAFAKSVVHRKTGKILGYHIIGPQASVLIQEVVNAMANDGGIWSVARGQHIHPALPEVVLKAFAKLREPEQMPHA